MSTEGTGALTSFHAFRRLPVELRFMIWKESLKANSSRVVEINFSFKTMRWHPCAPPPALLHVSQEARQLALQRYQAAPLQCNRPQPAMVFLDFSNDIVFLRSPSGPALDYRGRVYNQVLLDLESIRDNCIHIALPTHLVTGMPLIRLLAHFKRLQSLTIVAPTDTIRKPSNPHDEELSFVADRRTRKKMGRMLVAAEVLKFSTVVKVVHHAQAVRGEVSDRPPSAVDGKKRSK